MVEQRLLFKNTVNYQYVTEMEAGDGDSIEDDIILDVGANNLLLKVTQEEYTNLLSAATNGANVSWPDDYNEIIYPLIKAAKVTFCNAVLDCILNNTDIQEAIAKFAGGSEIPPDQELQQEIEDLEVIGGQVGCDNDTLYGQCIQMVDYLHAISQDIIEIAVNNASGAGRLGQVISGIPLVGLLPFDEAFTFAESSLEDWNEAYDAAYTTALRQEMICDLFCIAQFDCTLSLADVRDYYVGKTAGFVLSGSVEAFFGQINLYDFAGLTSVYGLHMFIMSMMTYGGSIFGIDAQEIVGVIQAFFNDPDPDWSTQCTECNDRFDVTFLFDQSAQGFVIEDGSWSAGRFFPARATQGSSFDVNELAVYIPMSGTFELQNVDATYSLTKGVILDNNKDCIYVFYDGSIQQPTYFETQEAPFEDPLTLSYGGLTKSAASNMYLRIKSCYVNTGDPMSGDCTWHKLRLRGTGTPVFG